MSSRGIVEDTAYHCEELRTYQYLAIRLCSLSRPAEMPAQRRSVLGVGLEHIHWEQDR